MTYKGDSNLEQLLRASNETRGLTEVRKVLAGVIAAPANIAAPELWLTLFRTDGNTELETQLTALKNQMAVARNMATQDKLGDLRTEMKKQGIDGFYVPRADEFQGEYVPECNERLAWVTGFTGSAGAAVILTDKAGFFTDGRYTLQAQAQVNAKDFEIGSTVDKEGTPAAWIEKNVKAGTKFGIDPWMHTPNEVKAIREAVEKAGATLVLVNINPLDAAWKGRPAAPLTPVQTHPLQYAGISSEDKRHELAAALKAKGADALAIAMPEDICWLLNIRGGDVPCTPFALSYAIAHADGTVDWFIDQNKVTDQVRQWVGGNVRIHDLSQFAASLKQPGKKIWVDPFMAPLKAHELVREGGSVVLAEKSPLQLMKALKNPTEIQGAINAHIRDGVALTRFLAAISEQGAAARHDEITASDLLQAFRAQGQDFRGLSFDTISGAGGNGAIVHYRSTPETNKPLLAGPVYLVDSGAQYKDGTTDVTRTIAVDNVTPEMKDRFTRVLKGHIQVAMSAFSEGTTGDKLDIKARACLKEAGLDFAHGTGHGVGSYLSVHEGPCGISPRSTTVPLAPGMIISNEPGYYKQGEYGIRIENLVTVIDTGKTDAEGKKLMGFKTLTLAPIDRNLIETSLLTDDELKWLNDYHAQARNTLLPLLQPLDPKAVEFLKKATEPLAKPGAPKAQNIKGLFL